MSTCSINNCNNAIKARGMCSKHWKRWKGGKNVHAISQIEKPLRTRIVESIKVSKTGCWIWQRSRKGNGDHQYGAISVNGKSMMAHRVSYEAFVGTIPDGGDIRGMCVCHKCDTPLCVNPDHLFIGDHTDNMRDKEEKERGVRHKKLCVNGHPRTPENLYTARSGSRHCLVCHKINERNRRGRLKAAGG